ncbi:hypothetical protein [Hafnia sp. HMSC23F03]|uniref:hypothetical protein n=1 Tax=Hafnia sp. HMSC23F03 TaxID=1581059 RepID=UPI0008A207CB|nr:hypothetical protein [Hafnia sp. HMSC23F03]OFS08314.1 hypothetical protein HMPREF3091_19270 [Hafnia sp. HMSC23F03]
MALACYLLDQADPFGAIRRDKEAFIAFIFLQTPPDDGRAPAPPKKIDGSGKYLRGKGFWMS